MIMIMLEPISEICLLMLCLLPCPMASMVMTEPTPMMMPSMVRNERSLLAAMARRAILRRLLILIGIVLWFAMVVNYSSATGGNAARASAAERMSVLATSLLMTPSRSTMLRLE